ncbi:hypothetical protein C8R44DRAFT_980967 [Mycena epipterygia]|nr:hypothetical protein C8R44DRAFT_980967 [Mycena epipterygia]
MPTGNTLAGPPEDKLALDKPLCGTIFEARYTARERREARAHKSQSWIVRKLMVAASWDIRPDGVGKESGCCNLHTPRQRLRRSTSPKRRNRTQWEAQDHDDPRAANMYAALADIEAGRIGGPAYEELNVDNSPATPPAAHVPRTTIPLPFSQTNGDVATPRPPPCRKSSRRSGKEACIPRGRFPPTTAPLLPLYRWCARCAIVKPYRAHHCRVCGTCVLKFDHHCPCAFSSPPQIVLSVILPISSHHSFPMHVTFSHLSPPLPAVLPSLPLSIFTTTPSPPSLPSPSHPTPLPSVFHYPRTTKALTHPPPTGIGLWVGAQPQSLVAFNVTDGRRSVDPQEVVVIALCVLSFIHPSIPSPSLPAPPFIPITTQGGGGEVLGGRIRGVYIV